MITEITLNYPIRHGKPEHRLWRHLSERAQTTNPLRMVGPSDRAAAARWRQVHGSRFHSFLINLSTSPQKNVHSDRPNKQNKHFVKCTTCFSQVDHPQSDLFIKSLSVKHHTFHSEVKSTSNGVTWAVFLQFTGTRHSSATVTREKHFSFLFPSFFL